jgi:hypothetical protein
VKREEKKREAEEGRRNPIIARRSKSSRLNNQTASDLTF